MDTGINITHDSVVFGVALVDFHHTRGPEVEHWHSDELKDCTWNNLPFQALPDGSHSFEESFTYFTLLYDGRRRIGLNGIEEANKDNSRYCTTLFAVSCSRQIKTEELIYKGTDVTRSTVQKSLVVISRIPIFGQIRDKLSIVTNALFLQRDFTDKSIIHTLYYNLKGIFTSISCVDESNLFVGISLRKIIHDFKRELLVILKAILLERKIIFYGSNVEELCSLQFGFISLIPNLIFNLEDCGSPVLNKYEEELTTCDSFRSSDRKSVLKFLGFPLQLFSKGGLFSPYTPLQQLGDLTSPVTKWYVIGTSNNLLLEQKHKLADILVNVDFKTVEMVSDDKQLQQALHLPYHDRKWMDLLVQNVLGTWNECDLSTPSTFQFEGSEDFIRWQFEEYLTGLLSAAKLDGFLARNSDNEMLLKTLSGSCVNENPIQLFNLHWVQLWKETQNFKLFYYHTDDRLFDLFEPRHVYNGNNSISAWQQRFVKSLKMLNRNDFRNSNNIEVIQSEVNNFEGRPADSEYFEERKGNENIRNGGSGWNSWKEYFNNRLKRKPNDSTTVPTKDIPSELVKAGNLDQSFISLSLHSTEKIGMDHSESSPDITSSLPKEIVENPWK